MWAISWVTVNGQRYTLTYTDEKVYGEDLTAIKMAGHMSDIYCGRLDKLV